MCRTLCEVRYPRCEHIAAWELPSPDPNCNGILHRFAFDRRRKCKHCWTGKGKPKRAWKRRRESFEGSWEEHRSYNKIIYPIHAVGLNRSSACPTWKRRWPWQTRRWAFRELVLRGMAQHGEYLEWARRGGRQAYYKSKIPRSTVIDRSTKSCAMLKEVAIEDLDPEDRECAICRSPFIDDDDPDECCSGGGQVARRILCPGRHVFGLECIKSTWRYANDERMPTECPTCRAPRWIFVVRACTIKMRLELMAEHQRIKFREGQRPIGDGDPPREVAYAISAPVYVLMSSSIIAAFPMFVAVDHSMTIWNSRNNSELPRAHMAVVFVVATLLQSIWLLALLFFPLVILFYYLWLCFAMDHSWFLNWRFSLTRRSCYELLRRMCLARPQGEDEDG